LPKSCLLFMERGVILRKIEQGNGQTRRGRIYSVSTIRSGEIWQSEDLEQALAFYNDELDRCAAASAVSAGDAHELGCVQ